MLKYFGIPFANSGGKTAVPATDPGTGAVSYPTGFGPYYQLAKTDPNSLNIDRQQTNQMFYDVTNEVKLLQQHGAPDFITAALNGGVAYSYGVGDVCRYSGSVYVSRVAANVDLPTVAASWFLVRLGGIPKTVAGGTADVITADFSPDYGTMLDGDTLLIQHGGANTGATTINPDGTGALSVYKGANAPLVAGDIAGANYWGLYVYDASLNKLQMLNPAAASAPAVVPKRQTILSGAAAFLAIGSGLNVNLTATATPLRLSFAEGFGANGAVDYVGSISVDTPAFFSGIVNTATNYLFAEQAPGSATFTGLASTLPCIAQESTTAASIVNGQHTYFKDTGQMYVGNGATATAVRRTAVGQCVAAGGVITSVTPYAKLRRSDSGRFAVTASTPYVKPHNLGFEPDNVNCFVGFNGGEMLVAGPIYVAAYVGIGIASIGALNVTVRTQPTLQGPATGADGVPFVFNEAKINVSTNW